MKIGNALKTIALLGFVATGAQANTMTSGSAISLAVDEPSTSIFVSYPGKLGDQCGIRLVVLGEFGFIGEEVTQKLVVKADDEVLPAVRRGNGVTYDFSHKVLGVQLFGIYVTLATSDGSNLSGLSTGEGQLLAVSTPCPEAQ